MGPGLTQGEAYPLPADRDEFLRLLSSADSQDRLRAAMASFRMQGDDLAEALARRLSAEGNHLVKATLVKAVGRFANPRYLRFLAGFLTDPDDRVRANTIEALGFYQVPEVVGLVNPLVRDESTRVRGCALLVLGRFHKQKTLALIDKLAVSPDPGMRETALFVLGKLGGEYGAVRLGRMLQAEPTAPLKRSIAQALIGMARRGDEHAARALEQVRAAGPAPTAPRSGVAPEMAALLGVGPEVSVGGDTVSLETAAWPTSAPPRADPPARYPEDLTSPVPRRRLEAVQLAPDEGQEVFRRLTDLLHEELDEFVIATLVKKVGRVGGPAAVSEILPYTRNPDGRVRANALEGLEAAGSADVFQVARSMLEDHHPRVRAQAARILASRNQDQGKAVAVLKEMLLEGDESGALSAVHALESIDASVILEILELALVQPHPRLQARVLEALRVMGEKSPLAARLAEKYSGGAAFEDEGYIGTLLGRMNSKDAEVRYDALKRLSLIHSPRIQSRIELATSDASEKVRNLAQAMVEDFGRAYKRQGVLHSLGLRAAECLRESPIEFPAGQEALAELDRLAKELADGDEGAEASSSLLAQRRELLVGLGEAVYRQQPGLDHEGVRELLGQLRDLDASEAAAAAGGMGGGATSPQASAQVLAAALREVEAGLDEDEAKKPRGGAPAAPGAPGLAAPGLRLARVPKHIFLLAFMMAVIGGVFLFVSGRVQSGLMGHVKPWLLPADSSCWVAHEKGFVFATTQRGDALSVAAPTGLEKWKRPVENLVPEQILVADGRVYLTTKLDQVLCLSAGKGGVLWSQPTGGAILPGVLLVPGHLLVGVARSDGGHEVRDLDPSSGQRRWTFAVTTGAPRALNARDGVLYLVSGSTLYGVGLGDGQERFSYDDKDDFARVGRLAVTDDGVVLAASGRRVIAIGSTGNPAHEELAWDAGTLDSHPIRLGPERFVVFAEDTAWVLDHRLTEVARVALPIVPEVWAGEGKVWHVSDGGKFVHRLELADGVLRVAGKAQATNSVVDLAAAGDHVVVGSRGVELLPAGAFE